MNDSRLLESSLSSNIQTDYKSLSHQFDAEINEPSNERLADVLGLVPKSRNKLSLVEFNGDLGLLKTYQGRHHQTSPTDRARNEIQTLSTLSQEGFSNCTKLLSPIMGRGKDDQPIVILKYEPKIFSVSLLMPSIHQEIVDPHRKSFYLDNIFSLFEKFHRTSHIHGDTNLGNVAIRQSPQIQPDNFLLLDMETAEDLGSKPSQSTWYERERDMSYLISSMLVSTMRINKLAVLDSDLQGIKRSFEENYLIPLHDTINVDHFIDEAIIEAEEMFDDPED